MERLNLHLAEALAQERPVHVVAPEGAAAHAPAGTRVHEVPLRPLWRFLLAAAWKSVALARRHPTALVLAGSGLTAPLAWTAAKFTDARCAAYLHGLDIQPPSRLYRFLWRPFLRRLDRVVVNSRPTAGLAEKTGITESRIAVVHPGVALPPPVEEEERRRIRQRFHRRFGLDDGPLLLSVGRLTTRKGLLEFVKEVLPLVARQQPNVQLAVIGDTPSDALAADAQTPERIREAAARHGLADRVHFLGRCSDAQLQAAYRAADLHVFPIRRIVGDPEGFGMVAIEAAAHGLATVAYASGGVVDAVSDGVSGRLIPPGESAAFAQAVLELLRNPLPREPIEKFAGGFAWEAFGARIRNALFS